MNKMDNGIHSCVRGDHIHGVHGDHGVHDEDHGVHDDHDVHGIHGDILRMLLVQRPLHVCGFHDIHGDRNHIHAHDDRDVHNHDRGVHDVHNHDAHIHGDHDGHGVGGAHGAHGKRPLHMPRGQTKPTECSCRCV